MINKQFYIDKAERMTEEYLKDSPDLKFVAVFDEDEKGIPIIAFKIVNKNDPEGKPMEEEIDEDAVREIIYNDPFRIETNIASIASTSSQTKEEMKENYDKLLEAIDVAKGYIYATGKN